ncbi:MAG TPA: hypothetical protein VFP57_01960 [Sphingomicrobium sp.]|nr:hypothetical protein [Sphingomicrobium sp.]
MNKESRIRRKTVELDAPARPSRIRREPVPIAESQRLLRNAWWESREWEMRLAIGGIIFFAVAIAAVVIDIGHLLSL